MTSAQWGAELFEDQEREHAACRGICKVLLNFSCCSDQCHSFSYSEAGLLHRVSLQDWPEKTMRLAGVG